MIAASSDLGYDAAMNTLRKTAVKGMAATVLAAIVVWGQALADASKALVPPTPLPKPDESAHVRINDIQMWYAVFNKSGGDPVLLIHGGLGTADDWGNQISALAKTHKVIVADSRGHGRSTRSAQPLGYALMADDYLALLRHLKVDKVAVVGQSDGAIIGLELAMRHPEYLTRLWAYAANFNTTGLVTDGPNPMTDPVFGPAIVRKRKEYERLSSTPADYDSLFKAVNEMWQSQPNYQAAELARIKTRTAIADGEREELIKHEHTNELARRVPGSKLVLLPGVGHLAMWQDPSLYNRELLRFLDVAGT